MKNAATEREKGFRDQRGGGGKCLENRKKILNRGNELKNLLKRKELLPLEAQNKLLFECKKPRTARKNRLQAPGKQVPDVRCRVPGARFPLAADETGGSRGKGRYRVPGKQVPGAGFQASGIWGLEGSRPTRRATATCLLAQREWNPEQQ
jgi:hypothetical protein